MIVKPTVNELLEHVENRYALVIAASRRAREISSGDEKLVDIDEKSPVTIASNEIAEGKVYVVDENNPREKQEIAEIEENEEKIEEE